MSSKIARALPDWISDYGVVPVDPPGAAPVAPPGAAPVVVDGAAPVAPPGVVVPVPVVVPAPVEVDGVVDGVSPPPPHAVSDATRAKLAAARAIV